MYREIYEMLGKSRKLRTVPTPIFRIFMYLIRFKAFLSREEPILSYPRFKRLTGNIICDDFKARSQLSFETCEIREMLDDSRSWLLSEGLIKKDSIWES